MITHRPTKGAKAAQLTAADFFEPIAVRRSRVAFENELVRAECRTLRNIATSEEHAALRVVPAGQSNYTAVVVPVLVDGGLMLLGRYRQALMRWSIEFPRIQFHTDDGGWKDAVARGLRHDTGLESGALALLGAIQLEPALLGIDTLVILAQNCVGSQPQPPRPAELIAGTLAVSGSELDDLLRKGEITCGATMAALCLYRAQLDY